MKKVLPISSVSLYEDERRSACHDKDRGLENFICICSLPGSWTNTHIHTLENRDDIMQAQSDATTRLLHRPYQFCTWGICGAALSWIRTLRRQDFKHCAIFVTMANFKVVLRSTRELEVAVHSFFWLCNGTHWPHRCQRLVDKQWYSWFDSPNNLSKSIQSPFEKWRPKTSR